MTTNESRNWLEGAKRDLSRFDRELDTENAIQKYIAEKLAK